MRNIEREKAIIFKVQIDNGLFWNPRGNQFSYFLITKPGLAGPPHSDDNIRLTFNFGKRLVSD